MLMDELKRHDKSFDQREKLRFSEHHLSHAASAFYPSPFKDAIILTADGVGEWATTTVAIGNENKLEIKRNTFSSFIGSTLFSFYILHRV